MTDREAPAALVRARICVCGHPASDHETECAFGWTGEPDEAEPCACESFVALAEEPPMTDRETLAALCPCGGACHHSDHPCSLGCWAAQRPWRAEEAAGVRLDRTPAVGDEGLRQALERSVDFRNLLAIVRSAVTEYSETQGRALASMELLSEAVRLLDAALAEEPR